MQFLSNFRQTSKIGMLKRVNKEQICCPVVFFEEIWGGKYPAGPRASCCIIYGNAYGTTCQVDPRFNTSYVTHEYSVQPMIAVQFNE